MAKSKLSSLKENFHLSEEVPGESEETLLDILVDADALVALMKENDTNHSKALHIAQSLQKRGCTWFVSPHTIGEVVTVISYKISQSAAKEALEELRRMDFNELTLKEDRASLADKWFSKQYKKGTSYFDCYNMALLDRYQKQLNAIFSFDSVYKRNGFKLTGEII